MNPPVAAEKPDLRTALSQEITACTLELMEVEQKIADIETLLCLRENQMVRKWNCELRLRTLYEQEKLLGET